MGKDKFLKGALILTVAGLMVKVIGSVNRILLSRLLGGEGIGLYQMAYPIYLLMLSVCSAGVPVAVSIIVAEKVAKNDYAQAHRIFKVTLGLMAVFGLFFALTLYGLAGFLVTTGWIRDGRAYYALVVLTPAVFFSSILASFRGYFQGYQMMNSGQFSGLFPGLSDDDPAGGISDFGAAGTGAGHDRPGLFTASPGTGVRCGRRSFRCGARRSDRTSCAYLVLPKST